MKAIDYLTRFSNDWACKEPDMQECILKELFKDWCDNFGGVGGVRAQTEWKAALADPDLQKYIDAKREGWQRFGDVAKRVVRGIPNGQ